jgi:proteasome-associated ATPase
MTRKAAPDADTSVLQHVLNMGSDAPPPEQKLELMLQFRAASTCASALLDQHLLQEIYRLHGTVGEVRGHQEELRALLKRLTAPPWHPAVYLGPGSPNGGPTAVVAHGSASRVVHVGDGVDGGALGAGDDVLLSHDLNQIVAVCAEPVFRVGEIATFDRRTADGRFVVVSRDEETVVRPAAAVRDAALQRGDLLRWDRATGMAFEVIERSQRKDFFLEDAPHETFDDIGGLDAQIEELKRAVLMRFHHADLVTAYGLKPKKSVLLWGPPGTGKTMMARALANHVAHLAPSGQSRFINVKPGALHSMWYAQSEKNYREVFRAAREAGERDPHIPTILFFDEIDAVGSIRGQGVTRVDDRVLTAFMAELDGLEGCGNVLVVASTNRRDALDPGLTRPGRLGDCVIHVGAPGRGAARAILGKHLRPGIPYACNGHGADAAAARAEILDAAVARLYAAHSDGDVAVAMLRDGKRVTVRARDLVSGAVLAKIALAAIERACVRDAAGAGAGVRLDDVAWAAEAELASAARVLTPANCRAYVQGLPQDVDVVSVQPVAQRAARRAGLETAV